MERIELAAEAGGAGATVGHEVFVKVTVTWRPRATGPSLPLTPDNPPPAARLEILQDPPPEQLGGAHRMILSPRSEEPFIEAVEHPDGTASATWVFGWGTTACFNDPYTLHAEADFDNFFDGGQFHEEDYSHNVVRNLVIKDVHFGPPEGGGVPDYIAFDPEVPALLGRNLYFTIEDEGVAGVYTWAVRTPEQGGAVVASGERSGAGDVVVSFGERTEPLIGPFEITVDERVGGDPRVIDQRVYRRPDRVSVSNDCPFWFVLKKMHHIPRASLVWQIDSVGSGGVQLDPGGVWVDLLTPALTCAGSFPLESTANTWHYDLVPLPVAAMVHGGKYRVVLRAVDQYGRLPLPADCRDHRDHWMTIAINDTWLWEAHCYADGSMPSAPTAASELSELADGSFYAARVRPYETMPLALAHLSEARVGHFAGHGYANCPGWDDLDPTATYGGGGMDAGMGWFFASNGHADYRALEDWDLSTLRLAVFQGCGTGLTDADHGSLVQVAGDGGADCAVGYEGCVETGAASTTWAETFYIRLAGRDASPPAATVEEACAAAAEAVRVERGWYAGYDRFRLSTTAPVRIAPAYY